MAELWLPRALRSAFAVHRGMARAGWRIARAARPGSPSAVRGASPVRGARRALAAGRSLARLGLAALAIGVAAPAQAQIVSTRIWPAKDYTRVTIESKSEIKFQLFAVKDPERLVVDLEGVEFGPSLAELHGKVATGDPYIDKLRAGRNRPGVVRLVLDLKTEVKPQAFTLKPVGEYGHRLVIDLYPTVAPDPLLALIEADRKRADPVEPDPTSPPRKSKVARLATIVIDPGHGGED